MDKEKAEKICPLSLASDIIERCRKEECQWWTMIHINMQGKEFTFKNCAIAILAMRLADR